MMWRQFAAFGVIWGVFVGLGVTMKVEVSMEQENAGFFLKPMFRGQEVFRLNSLERPMVVLPQQEPVVIKAKYGPFTAKQTVPASLLEMEGSIPSFHQNQTVDPQSSIESDIDISAHLVSRTVTQERPQVSVLFHALTLSHTEKNKIKMPRNSNEDVKWCVQMYAEYHKEEVTSVCVLSAAENVCVADALLPLQWWNPDESSKIGVFFSYFRMDKQGHCRPANVQQKSDIIMPSKEEADKESLPELKNPQQKLDEAESTSSPRPVLEKILVSFLTLSYGQVTYQELKEDQHILVYIPQKSFYPGSKFTVPIKLQAESDLQIFVIRVKARHGIRIIDAIPSDASRWDITLETSHKSKGAMVTARVADLQKYSKTDRVQNIFDFVFEVEDGASGEDRGRLAFTLAYEMNTQQREVYGSVENKVVARIDIQHDNTVAIVPVIKKQELINVAMLTGKMISEPMRIYSISQNAKVTDITSTTTCHSGDEHVLKVSQSCDLVYLDGSERKGAKTVSIIAKFGRHSELVFFKVWAPEYPLEIQVSDDKLSQIKRWKVPIDASISRQTRGVDFGLLNHQDYLFQDDDMRSDDVDANCRLRYQQTDVEVYARFMVEDTTGQREYFVHNKAFFSVTDPILDRLRVADVSVARITGNIVEGLKPGRTEIQALNREGRVIGAHAIRVGKGKVMISKLNVNVVTGVSLTLDNEPQMEGVLKANVHRDTQLMRSHQEGILDISILFDDGTSTALHQVPKSDYILQSVSLNSHIVAFDLQLSEDVPRVIALGPGKGELLKVSLELSDTCHRKKSPNLALSYAYIDINFKDLQSDSGHYGNNRVNDRNEQNDVPSDPFLSKEDLEELAKSGGKGSRGYPGSKADMDGILVDDLDFPKPISKDDYIDADTQQQLVFSGVGMTPLEIGMYVLLAIFCMAIIVFMVNCVIFVARYKRKRKPEKLKDPVTNVNDWVWIGRATLERNAISTTCSQALMSEADFNGNHNTTQYLAPPEPTTSNRSSAVTESSSNRNSVISTYKGSECSIRITANPLTTGDTDNTDADLIEEDSTSAAPSTLERPVKNPVPPPVPPHANKLPERQASVPETTVKKEEAKLCLTEAKKAEVRLPPAPSRAPEARASVPVASTSNNKPSNQVSRASCPGSFGFSSDSDDMGSLGKDYFQKDSPKPGSSSSTISSKSGSISKAKKQPEGACALDKDSLRQACRDAFQTALAESIKAQQDSANGNVASGNISEAEWDYELMGLTYDQLLDYFDNLKESTA